VIPYTIGDYLASNPLPRITNDHPAFKDAATNAQRQIDKLLTIKGARGIREIHRELGRIMWDDVGMARTEASLRHALEQIPKLREEFWNNVSVPGSSDNLNQSLEYAGRVADYLEFAELLATDALHRRESAGGHSARRARRRTAKRCATTTTTRTWRPGSSKASASSRSSTRSRWCSRKFTPRRGATMRVGNWVSW
jgi:succinate dehydrogenase/fumarate reductase flavoprotein subunit